MSFAQGVANLHSSKQVCEAQLKMIADAMARNEANQKAIAQAVERTNENANRIRATYEGTNLPAGGKFSNLVSGQKTSGEDALKALAAAKTAMEKFKGQVQSTIALINEELRRFAS